MRLLLFIRSFLACIGFVILTFALSASAIFFSVFTSSVRIPRYHIKWWGQAACWLFGVKVVVIGKELWRRNSGGVVLFNHTSFFDIFAMAGYLPDMGFGAKIELFKIPIFGAAMRRVGILPIDRQRKEKVFKIYHQAIERLKAGEKVALAPEGTRTSNPDQLSSFKSGPFIFALQSKVDIIPVVIRGAFEVYSKNTLLPNLNKLTSTIYLIVLEPVPTTGEVEEKRIDLQNLTKSRMQAVLDSGIGKEFL